PLEVALRPAILDDERLPRHPPEVAQALLQGGALRPIRRRGRDPRQEDAEPRDLRGLRRGGPERGHENGEGQGHKAPNAAPSHLPPPGGWGPLKAQEAGGPPEGGPPPSGGRASGALTSLSWWGVRVVWTHASAHGGRTPGSRPQTRQCRAVYASAWRLYS